MFNKMIVAVSLFVVFCSLSAVYAMSSAPLIKKIEITAESFAPGTYKIYKNNELGFSFKYPKNWYIDEVAKGGWSFWKLYNFDPQIGEADMLKEDIVDITISATGFPSANLKKEDIRDYFKGDNPSKPIKEMVIKGGKLYFIQESLGAVGNGKKFDLAYLYLLNAISEGDKSWDYVVRFLPFRVGEKYQSEYFKLLRSIEIINK